MEKPMRNSLFPHCGLWLTVVCFALAPVGVLAAGVEARLFAVQVDGKLAGECRLNCSQVGGSETLAGSASVSVKHLLGTYHYRYAGTEVWKADRLQRLECSSDDDGKKCALQASAGETELRVTANGRTSRIKPDVWTSSYWHMPAPAQRGAPLGLLDVDTGRVLAIRFNVLGTVRLTVAGQPIDCTQCRVSGQSEADLWYDAQGRLVRQISIEDGHRTVLELKEIRR
jgi:hypothetical protein